MKRRNPRKRTAEFRPVTRRSPVSEKPSPTYFKDRADPKNYSFEVADEWMYRDRKTNAANKMQEAWSPLPHLVLSDASGKVRFTLRYGGSDTDRLIILSIQRERTRYSGTKENRTWDAQLETQKSKEFQAQLGGVHPAEFLLSEFIFRHREAIKHGKKVYLQLYVNERGELVNKGLYGPLIDRFFRKKPISIDPRRYQANFELSPDKRRVRQILGV